LRSSNNRVNAAIAQMKADGSFKRFERKGFVDCKLSP
jgi:hypothetical protein